MKKDIELPFSYVPRLLSHYEAMHPMTVLAEFFDDNSPQGHASEWKAWRDCAAAAESYQDMQQGPASLLYLHKLNVRLLEALYLLLLAREARPHPGLPVVTAEQLTAEKVMWDYFPDELTEEQLRSPYLLIERCFRRISMAEYHYYLDTMLKDALSIRRNAEVNMSAHALLKVYEEVLLLQAAAWLLHQRQTIPVSVNTTALVNNKLITSETVDVSIDKAEIHSAIIRSEEDFVNRSTDFKKLRLMELSQELPVERLNQLTGLCAKVIVRRLPLIKAIYFMGEAQGDRRTLFLFIIVDPAEQRSGNELSALVEKCAKCVGAVTPIIMNENALVQIQDSEPHFVNQILHECKPLFISPYWQMPHVPLPDKERFLAQREVELPIWHSRYEAWLALADQSFTQDNYALTLVLLRQALQAALSATLRYRTGYRLQIENLRRLLLMTRLFTPTLAGLFGVYSPEGRQRLQLLNSSSKEYQHNQYYAPGQAVVKELLERVSRGIEFCRQACRQTS